MLVVDDRAPDRELLATVLTHLGHRVREAANGEEGIEFARTERPDLILADILMPTMDGYEFVRRLRSDPAAADIPVVFCTATYAVDEVRRLADACGVSQILIKPYGPPEIMRIVKAALGSPPEPVAPLAAEDFHREHLRVLNAALIQKVDEQERLHRRFRQLVEQLPAIVYLWEAGTDGQCYFVSPAVEPVLGYSVEEWLADPRLWADRIHPDDRDRVVAAELRSRETGEDLACEYRMLAKDGHLVWIRDQAAAIRSDGAGHHLQGLMYDVSAEKEAQDSLRRSREETIRRLSRAAEFRDDETGAHIERVSHYCELIAVRLGLGPELCEQMRIASPMHDVGKIGVADAILLKRGPLDADQRAEMERHADIGYRILAGSGAELLDLAATIARTHHERFDGSGYPRGLEGEEIPLEGRIAAVADVFDALTSDRPYRPRFSRAEAVEMMRADRGSHFDPRVLDAFLGAEDEISAIAGQPAPAIAAT
ncbi:MAG: cyclic di-GMP phosphodiesterase [Solirubrobacteraceae bacterium]|nr:cyclic di-GMP phosphodiesterase [Solirubrobacteraceae bacterium]